MNTIQVKELMTRYGFLLQESTDGYVKELNQQNKGHFLQIMHTLTEQGVALTDNIAEANFVKLLEQFFEFTGESLFAPSELALHTVDIYVRGLVMQLNRLGCGTTFSCDGHDSRRAHIYFENTLIAKKAVSLLEYVGVKCRIQTVKVTFENSRYELPQFAGFLAEISEDQAIAIWNESNPLVRNNEYNSLMDELLSIYGVSGEEADIRAFVIEQLKPYVDYLEVDHYGNLLAQTRKGNTGPTILLNAHLDTVEGFVDGRTIVKEGNIWSSSEGILGADDRAGVCVLIAVARSLHKSHFQGTVKFVFTVEEEIGLVGARQVAKSFLWDVGMAVVVDRRGTGDIVTSCGGNTPFCTPEFARKVERLGNRVHRNRWQAVAGGSSDTRIWAEQGIESINLSAGYYNEHYCDETLDIVANYGTFEFVMQLIEESRYLLRVNTARVV